MENRAAVLNLSRDGMYNNNRAVGRILIHEVATHVTSRTLEKIRGLQSNIKRVFYGKDEVVKSLLVALFSNGHVLIDGVPGVGKTLLAKTLAKSLDCRFQRIQFTADMLPSNVTGVSVCPC